VPAGDRARVTTPLQRLGDERANDGVGLGFSIAQGFIDAMHGTLTLDDTPGGGLTVTITLPKAPEVAG
jgi:two-component system sensor histidine kinase KdpD